MKGPLEGRPLGAWHRSHPRQNVDDEQALDPGGGVGAACGMRDRMGIARMPPASSRSCLLQSCRVHVEIVEAGR